MRADIYRPAFDGDGIVQDRLTSMAFRLERL